MREARHAAIVWIDEEEAAVAFGQWRQSAYLPIVKHPQLPEEAKLEGVFYDWQRRAFGLRYTHDSLPFQPEGQQTEAMPGFGDVSYEAVNMKQIPGLAVRALRPKDGDVVLMTAPREEMEAVKDAARNLTETFPGLFFLVMPKGMDAVLMPSAYREYVERFGPNSNSSPEQIESFIADVKRRA